MLARREYASFGESPFGESERRVTKEFVISFRFGNMIQISGWMRSGTTNCTDVRRLLKVSQLNVLKRLAILVAGGLPLLPKLVA